MVRTVRYPVSEQPAGRERGSTLLRHLFCSALPHTPPHSVRNIPAYRQLAAIDCRETRHPGLVAPPALSRMGRLRMKETPQERLDRKQRELEEKKASKRSKKRRRRREEATARESRPSKHYRSSSSSSSSSSDSDKPRRSRKGKERAKDDIDEDSDSYVPPRPSKDRPYVPYSFDDDDTESRIPSASSHKPERAREEEEFNQKLFDAMREDEGGLDPYSEAGRYSGFSYDYREADPSVGNGTFGRTGVRDDRFVDPVSGVVLNRVIFKDAMNDEE